MGAAAASDGGVARALVDTWKMKTIDQAVKVLSAPDVEVMMRADKDRLLLRLPTLGDQVKAIFERDHTRRIAAEEEKAQQAAAGVRQQVEESKRERRDQHLARVKVLDDKIALLEKRMEEAMPAMDLIKAGEARKELENLTQLGAEQKWSAANLFSPYSLRSRKKRTSNAIYGTL